MSMSIFGGFKETSDAAERNKDNRPEISEDAQAKFEKIMGDEQLPETGTGILERKSNDSPLSSLLDKSENLFEKQRAPIRMRKQILRLQRRLTSPMSLIQNIRLAKTRMKRMIWEPLTRKMANFCPIQNIL